MLPTPPRAPSEQGAVVGREADGGGEAITGAVISLAHALQMRVVGEGIETAAQLERLRSLGCDVGQGYHFSRPLPRGEMGRLLARNPRFL